MMLDNPYNTVNNSRMQKFLSWTVLSTISRKAITSTEWYDTRNIIKPTNDTSSNSITDEHHVSSVDSPFSTSLLAHLQVYLNTHNTSTFLIRHKGNLVYSHYADFHPNDVFNSMSLVKTVLGLCIGIAIDRGFIASLDDPAYWYLPEWQQDARKYISIDHLLTMQSGLHSDIRNAMLPIISLQFSNDIHSTALSLPAVAPPAHHFVYNNYNSQLLGIILERATGMTFTQFISKYLWQPLQGGNAFCYSDKRGHSHTFAGLFARPIDWLKIGSLFTNKGQYQGIQVVPQQWLQTMTTPMNTLHNGVKNAHGDYGRHIWLESHHYGVVPGIPRIEGVYAKNKFKDTSMVYCEGLRGQYVFISPKHDLVVMRMGERPKRNWDATYVINHLIDALNITQ